MLFATDARVLAIGRVLVVPVIPLSVSTHSRLWFCFCLSGYTYRAYMILW